MPAMSPTPTDNGLAQRLGDFGTLTSALDYAAAGRGGMNFYTARGELSAVLGWERMREEAVVLAGRLLARGLVPGDRVAIVAETDADFPRALMACLYARLVPCPAPLPSANAAISADSRSIRRRSFKVW